MLKREVQRKEIHGIQGARQAPVISHLFFVDDNLLFTRANNYEAEKIMEVLQQYQNSFGQVVNWKKSEASFSGNMSGEVKSGIRSRMGLNMCSAIPNTWDFLLFWEIQERGFRNGDWKSMEKDKRMEEKVSF